MRPACTKHIHFCNARQIYRNVNKNSLAGTDSSCSDDDHPRYMAPEQQSGKFMRATDVYAMGATLMFAATGEHPFRHVAGSAVNLMLNNGAS